MVKEDTSLQLKTKNLFSVTKFSIYLQEETPGYY